MNKKRQILLFEALKNGRIDTKTANNYYSQDNGKDALISLEWEGYLEHTGWGNFVPNTDKAFPNEVVERYKTWKKSQDSSDNLDVTSEKNKNELETDSESEYNIIES